MNIEAAIDALIRREGGYVNDPADGGGPTNFGVTQETLAAHRGRLVTIEEVKGLSITVAREIYRDRYWRRPRLELLPVPIQEFVFDAAVNHGPVQAIKFAQQVCNAAGFGPLAEDGACGPRTAAAAAKAQEAMGPWLRAALVEQRRQFYEARVRGKPDQAKFLKGWLNRLADFEVSSKELDAWVA